LSLIEALKTPPEPKSRVAAILLKVGEEERLALFEALGDRTWTHQALADVLTGAGHKVSEASVRRYRRDVLRWVS
jgi:hypothetical protein